MKMLFVILIALILDCNFIIAQENLFEKVNASTNFTKDTKEKMEKFKTRWAIKQWETVQLKSNIVFSKNFRGIFNIFDKNIEFEITKELWKNKFGVQEYEIELKDDGHAILSCSFNGWLGASIWYKESFYSIEYVKDGIYFVSETDISEIAKQGSPNDYDSIKKLNKTTQNTSITSTLSPATIKVFVAYTPYVAQNYNIGTLVSDCELITNRAFQNSLVSSRINIVGYQQLTYTESGNSITDVHRFAANNDGYMDEIHSLRNQYEADVCVLLENDLDYQGYSDTVGADFNSAFCVVRAASAVSYYTFPHELGHLFGCRHDFAYDSGMILPLKAQQKVKQLLC